MKISILTIGYELLRGATVNTNFSQIAAELNKMGVPPVLELCAGDDPESIKESFLWLLDKSDLVISTGGLGPTSDDITKAVLAECLGIKLYEDSEVRKNLEQFWKARGRKDIPESVFNQSLVPEGAEVIGNNHGTAPGIHIQVGKGKQRKDVIMLPGPPHEAIPMLNYFVLPFVKCHLETPIFSRTSIFAGLPESTAEEKVKHLFEDRSDISVAYCASPESLTITVSSAKVKLVSSTMLKVRRLLAENLLSGDNKNLQEEIFSILKSRNEKIAVVESCTGGKISAALTDVPGASAIFPGGFVPYGNEWKNKFLKVEARTLEKFGAVSEECAAEMALNIAKIAEVDASISVTGIAGPAGGSTEKPVGLVFIGTCYRGRLEVKRYLFPGLRETIRRRTVATAFNQLRVQIRECNS